MSDKDELRSRIDQTMRETALVVGGLHARGQVTDEVAWQLIHSLRASRIRALRRGRVETEPTSRRHPAIAAFLRELARG